MSTIGDALRGIQKIPTLQVRMDQLEASNRKVAADNKALADGLHLLNGRIARIEGYIDGVNAAAPRRTRLPKA